MKGKSIKDLPVSRRLVELLRHYAGQNTTASYRLYSPLFRDGTLFRVDMKSSLVLVLKKNWVQQHSHL